MPAETVRQIPPYKLVSSSQGVTRALCPRCRTGKVFSWPFWNLFRFARMNEECPHCGQDFRVEPGFYVGSMYFTYAVNVATVLISLVVLGLVLGIRNPWLLISVPSGLTIIFLPLNFRLSRVLMLYLFANIPYQPKYAFPYDVKNLTVDFRKSSGDPEAE